MTINIKLEVSTETNSEDPYLRFADCGDVVESESRFREEGGGRLVADVGRFAVFQYDGLRALFVGGEYVRRRSILELHRLSITKLHR